MPRENKMREARDAAEITQRELARRTGMHHGHVARYELGQVEPLVSAAVRIANALGSTVEAIWPLDPETRATAEGAQVKRMATKSKTNWTSYVKKMAETFQPTWRNNKPGQSRKVTIQLEVPVEGAKHNGFVMAVVDGKPDRETRLPLANFDDDIGAVIKLLCDYVRDEK